MKDYKEELGIVCGTVITIAGLYHSEPIAVVGGILIAAGSAGVNIKKKLSGGL